MSGHKPTLIAAFLYFDASFMVWVLLGPLAPLISQDLRLSGAQQGLMVALPSLAGAVLRLLAGLAADWIGAKRTGIVCQSVVIVGLLWAFGVGIQSYAGVLVLGLILGFAGASFAVALPMASRWYPPQYQGTALGIAALGNSGSVLTALFAPMLAQRFGWNAVLGLSVLPLVVVLAVFVLGAKDGPHQRPGRSLSNYFVPLRTADAWWFMLLYGVSFGGFVGLAASLSSYFTDSYALTGVEAGYFTAACVLAGSLARPLGGAIADRIGGVNTLTTVYLLASAALAAVGCGLSLAASLVGLILAMLALGAGNGAVFQLVPQRFGAEMGLLTGLVGMGGGIGGFFLSFSLGLSLHFTGDYGVGLLLFAGLALVALCGLTAVKHRWRATWGSAAAGIRI
jgi:NNP family nitrate/nitrite transporter-like MFS transporter